MKKLAALLWSLSGIWPEKYMKQFSLLANSIFILLKTNITNEEIIEASFMLKMLICSDVFNGGSSSKKSALGVKVEMGLKKLRTLGKCLNLSRSLNPANMGQTFIPGKPKPLAYSVVLAK